MLVNGRLATGTIGRIMDVTPDPLLAIAKCMLELDDLVRLLRKALTLAKPWQRQLGSQLSEIDRLLQVLRMTVVIGRPDSEIVAASEILCLACRKTGATIAASRCDLDTKAAVLLIIDLANGVRNGLQNMDSTQSSRLRQAL